MREAYDLDDEEFFFKTPPGDENQKAILQLSYNQQDWQSVVPTNQSHSYLYYNAPQITSISPKYGPVKSTEDEYLDIWGKNFQCPDPDCKELFVRFGEENNPDNQIKVKGELISGDHIRCKVPKYTKPDVLPVEVTFNDQDYTNDRNTYGFFDPYILDVKPRLINIRGTTRVRLYGFGFVNSTGTDLKSKFATSTRGDLVCTRHQCTQMAEYIDKTIIETPTYPQSQVTYGDTSDNIEFNPLTVEACVYGNTFTENNIEIYYYEEPVYSKISQEGSPANNEDPLFIKSDFKYDKNDPERLKKHSNFTCRFTSLDGKKVVYTKGYMVHYPLSSNEEDLPDHVQCATPQWKLTKEPGKDREEAKMDISVNG